MLNFTFTKLTALAGVFIFAVKSATVECAKPLRMVQLLSEANGFYVTAYWPNGALRVDSEAYSHASTFEVHLVPGRNDQWQLRALKNNLYIAAANGGGSICTADRGIASGWETFTVTELGNNRVQLKTFDGHFLGIDGSSTSLLIATATKADSWETFKVVEVPQRRGVNAGSWLVPERWMFELACTASSELWAGTTAPEDGKPPTPDTVGDLHTLSVKLGREEISRRMKQHWSTWLTESDFAIMASRGINHVRLPIGYWDIVESPPYAFGGAEYIDMAIKWAAARGITVSIDLHGAPGSQNGEHHSGQGGVYNWHLNSESIKLTVKVLGMISERWGKNPAVWGIEMLNEPGKWSNPIPRDILTQFYRDGYAAIRQHSPTVHVIMNSFVGPHEWIKDVLPEPQYRNVVLDLHLYAAFSDGHYNDMADNWGKEIRALTPYYPVIVGEMSLGVKFENFGNLSPQDRQIFADKSMTSFVENAYGFMFWSYKLRGKNEAWAFKDAFNYVKDYYLPGSPPTPTSYCGCNSCTQTVWDKIVTDSAGSHSCGSRIMWLQTSDGQCLSEATACDKVASEFPAECLCGSMSCTRTNQPTTNVPLTTQPTTSKPTTTSEPTTQKPSTRKPSTRKPTTRKPTTRKPTTRKPTQVPTYEPTTESPTTNSPTTDSPTTDSPTTESPTTESPTTSQPTSKPTTSKPTTRRPSTRKPSTRKPSTRKPTTSKPIL